MPNFYTGYIVLRTLDKNNNNNDLKLFKRIHLTVLLIILALAVAYLLIIGLLGDRIKQKYY